MKSWRVLGVVEVIPSLLHLPKFRALVVVLVKNVPVDAEAVAHDVCWNVLREPVRYRAASPRMRTLTRRTPVGFRLTHRRVTLVRVAVV